MESRRNNFNLLRFGLAVLVIVSHSPELVDGDRHRELLTVAFGTISFGDFAVDGFFLISGYLITQSWVNAPGIAGYLRRRALRIVPAFVVAFLVCWLLLLPIVGGGFGAFAPPLAIRQLWHIVTLQPPEGPGAFPHNPSNALDGSMWTISYEFRCYLLVPLLSWIGAFTRRGRWALLVLTAGLLIANSIGVPDLRIPVEAVFGVPNEDVRFAGIFLSGTLFFLFADKINLNIFGLLSSICLLFVCLKFFRLAESGIATFGGYIIFWLALRASVVKFGSKRDLSYGIYLYAWPIQNAILLLIPSISPWILCASALLLVLIPASVSWYAIEKPALGAARSRHASQELQRTNLPATGSDA